MLFPKDTDMSALRKAIEIAAVEKWGNDKAKWPKPLRNPLRDGDEKSDLNGYAGHYFVAASSQKMRPGLVDRHRQPITEESQFYAGCWAMATVVAFAYDKAGNRGVSFSLQNVMKVRDDEAFSGRRRAEDDFGDIELPDDSSTAGDNFAADDGWA
jgi:hypothetical protein